MWRLDGICLFKDLYHGMPYYNVWQISNYLPYMTNSVGIYENRNFSVASMYNALIQSDVPIDKINHDKLWKLKIPLWIKVFWWYLCKRVVLTKDNLEKQNWHRSKKCIFLSPWWINKTLILPLSFAKSIWSVIQLASTLFPPCSIANFRNWINGTDHRFKKHIRMGAIVFIWSLWLCRNDKVFNDKNSSILQVIYMGISTLYLWSSLQRVEHRDLFMKICARLEAIVRDTFPNMGDRIAYDRFFSLGVITIAHYDM
jgi:hypothetical protein